MGRLRVGIDVVDVRTIRESVTNFGQAYLDRVFTAHEQACAIGDESVQARALAARFAAKEATMKVLRPTPEDAIPWTAIEIWRSASGWCEVKLADAAQYVADREAVTDLAVSFSHEGDLATAVVVGMSGDVPRGEVSDDRRDDP